MDDFIFNQCDVINSLLQKSTKESEQDARDLLFQLLSYHSKSQIRYSPLVNHLIRLTGLYPYLEEETCLWEDRFVKEMFKINNGEEEDVLHIEQSNILKKLLKGESIAVSAPTSFGKSFIIDAFIAIKKPLCVLIIVPTLALLNECRRRINRKFSDEYKIITTVDSTLADKNILILTQERALYYVKELVSVDLLVVDEFYKVSVDYDSERAPILQKLILDVNKITKQKYFLAPNIDSIHDSILFSEVDFINMLDFNTVFLNVHEVYKDFEGTKKQKISQKSNSLITLLKDKLDSKSLIYTGTYTELENVSSLIIEYLDNTASELSISFAKWVALNYSNDWYFLKILQKGFGIHSGQLHRPLAQIQMKLFEEKSGLTGILSTSSIVEGINSSAENVFIWRDRNGTKKLNYFLYKNIIGRAGRMFKYFVGEVYLLESPPIEGEIQLNINFSDKSLMSLSTDNINIQGTLTRKQIAMLKSKKSIEGILGVISIENALHNNLFQSSNYALLIKIHNSITTDKIWNGLSHLNSKNSNDWRQILFKICNLMGNVGTAYNVFVDFIINLYPLRGKDIPCQLDKLGLSIDEFFKLERKMAFSIPPLVKDIQLIYNLTNEKDKVDLSSFYTKISFAFLPKNVYLLEEYGLPRMIARNIHRSGLVNLVDNELEVNDVIKSIKSIGFEKISETGLFDEFDKYILKYFFEGI